jgi:hypothetical protein
MAFIIPISTALSESWAFFIRKHPTQSWFDTHK